jgi:hypothetical protein
MQGHYSFVVRALDRGSVVTSSTKVWYPTSFMFVTSASIFNLVTCFIVLCFTMVHGDFLGVLEAVPYDERLTQIDRCTIL